MPNVGSLLKDEITRVSRKEIRKETLTTKKATTQHRHLIAVLSKRVGELERQVAALSRKVSAATPVPAADATPKRSRFSPKALLTQRNRLGLSAGQFGSLVGVSAQSIYNWEKGKASPRAEQLAKVTALRGVGKREVAKRLEQLQSE
jgi:DNA-binding transcriptional regulator YiaG